MKKLTAAQKAYRAVTLKYGDDSDISFIANVIFCHCANVTKKLNNLIKLVETGHDVRTMQFKLFWIRVDGEPQDLNYLDKVK